LNLSKRKGDDAGARKGIRVAVVEIEEIDADWAVAVAFNPVLLRSLSSLAARRDVEEEQDVMGRAQQQRPDVLDAGCAATERIEEEGGVES
jgi:hypothetical protein